jgi:AraC-like DNA-binding protein
MSALVRAAVLTNYFEVSAHLGLNPQRLIARVGLNRKLLADPDQRIPLTAAIELLEESALATGCETFGLRMAESRQMADFGVISLLLSHQRTLRDALATMMQYRHLLNESLAIHIEEAGRTVVLREEIVADVPASSRQATELAIGVLYRLCSALLSAHWHPQSVNFTHGAPADLNLHRRIFRCKVVFDDEFNGIVCPAADLDYANPLADPTMARHAARFVDALPGGAPSTVLDVRKAIYVGLPMGRATIEQISQALGMNVRTLQRRLEEGDRTFSDLINEVRRELAVRYMENQRYPMRRIAELLGYSMLSSFTRWFTTQFGAPPTVWRATRLARSRNRKTKGGTVASAGSRTRRA